MIKNKGVLLLFCMIFISDTIYGSSSSTLEQSVPNSAEDMRRNESENATVEFSCLTISKEQPPLEVQEEEIETITLLLPIKEFKREKNKRYCITTYDNEAFREIDMNSIAYCFNIEDETQMYLLELRKDPDNPKNAFFKKVVKCGIDKSKSELEKIKEEITFYFEILKTGFIPDMNSFIEMKSKIIEMNSEEGFKNKPNYHLYNFLFKTYYKLKDFFKSNPEDASLLTVKYINQIPFLFEYNYKAVFNFIKFFPFEALKYFEKFISNINENDNWKFYSLLRNLKRRLLLIERTDKNKLNEFLLNLKNLFIAIEKHRRNLEMRETHS